MPAENIDRSLVTELLMIGLDKIFNIMYLYISSGFGEPKFLLYISDQQSRMYQCLTFLSCHYAFLIKFCKYDRFIAFVHTRAP